MGTSRSEPQSEELAPILCGITASAETSALVCTSNAIARAITLLIMASDDPISANNGSVQACGDGNEGNWCCTPAVEDGTCDCQSGKGTFSIEQGIAQIIIGVFGLESTSTIPPHPSTSSALVSSKTPSSSISSTSTASSTSSRTSSSSKSSTQTQSSTQSSTHATSSTTSHSVTAGSAQSTASSVPVSITNKVGFKAGISVAVIVVVLALLGVAGFFWKRRWKRKRALETPPRDDDSEIFQMQERASAPHIIRLNPDPYEFTPSSGTPAPRMGNRNEMWNRDHGRLSPPVNNPYSIPYEALTPGIRPYEGT